MRATIYEALEVPVTAETSTIRSALRAVLRRFWSVPRDASGDTEEAVRFVALGVGLLTDAARRQEYDVQSRRGASTNPWRMSRDGTAGADSNLFGAPGSEAGSAQQVTATNDSQRAIPAVRALTEALPEIDDWSSAVAYVLSATVLGAAALFVYFAAHLSLGSNTAMLLMLLVLACGLGIATQTKVIVAELSGFTLARLAITKWRRETSVFVGNPPPQQDTAWIFRLRVMELTRSAAGYSSATHIGIRTLARCTDYALIALLFTTLLSVVGWILPSIANAIDWLRSPLLLPVIVVLLAIPVEAFALAKWRTTPGKFMLGVVVACAVTQLDNQPSPSVVRLAGARAFAFARNAACFGVWPWALLRLASQLRSLRTEEGTWEAVGDSVTLVRAAPLLMRASAASLVLAVSTGFAIDWYADLVRGLPAFTKSANEMAIAPLKDAAKQISDATKTTPASSDVVVTNRSATSEVPNARVDAPTSATPTISSPVTPAPIAAATQAPTSVPKKSESPPPAGTKASNVAPERPQSDYEKQAAVAQQRRSRIEAAEKLTSAARAKGSYASLQNTCERWTQDQPGSAQAWRCLGLAQFQSGAGRGSLPALRQALKIEPNDSEIEAAIFSILRP